MATHPETQGGALMAFSFRFSLSSINPFVRAMEWLREHSRREIQRALKHAAEPTIKKMKQQLWEGGIPKFAPLKPFSIAIRRAMGIEGQRPAKGSYTLAKLIEAHKVNETTMLIGISNQTSYPNRASLKAAQVGEWLEFGRKAITLDLDKPSSRTGKTPRQWLMWLYLQGALKSPPSKRMTHMVISAAPARPFVANTWEQEKEELPKRIFAAWSQGFNRFAGSSAPQFVAWRSWKA